MKRIFIGAASLLMSFALSAAEVDVADVELAAKGWVRDNAQAFGQMGAFQSVKAELDAGGQPLWYWVIMEKGTVVVAPDSEIDPIVALLPGCKGALPERHPMRALLTRDLTQRCAYARALAAKQTAGPTRLAATRPLSAAAARWERLKARGDTSHPSLMAAFPTPSRVISWLKGFDPASDEDGTTLRFWNQDASPAYFTDIQIFNLYTPTFEMGFIIPSPCGCVATAGATVLQYLNVTSCVANVARECEMAGIGKTNLYTRGGVYDWSLVPTRPKPGEEPVGLEAEALDLLARVASDVGVSCHMSYTPLESGAFTWDLAYGLRKDFGVASARCVNRNGPGAGNVYPIESTYYDKLIYNPIRAGSPVLFGISYSQAKGGHEVVAAGYGQDDANKDFTFIFTGWGGSGDGWYALPNIDTKATIDSDGHVFDVIGDLITLIDRDGRTIPLVGRVTDKDSGAPVANAWIWLEGGTVEGGTMVKTDENGYWGMRVDPMTPTKVVYDPTGAAHSFFVGENAYTPDLATMKEGVAGCIAAADLARALPEVMDFEIDTSKIVADPSGVSFQTDYDTAVRLALAEGKLLYVFGCAAGTPTAADYMAYLRGQDKETFLDKYVFLHLDNVSRNGVAYVTVDPRVFDRTKDIRWLDTEEFAPGQEVWIADYEYDNNRANGCVEPSAWSEGVCKVESAVVNGPDNVVSRNGESGQYTLTVVYDDGKTNVLDNSLIFWEVDRPDKCTIDGSGLLKPVPGAFAEVTVSAQFASGGETKWGSKAVSLMTDTAVVIGGDSEANPLIVPADEADENVTSNAFALVRDGNVLPTRADNVIGNIKPGDEVAVEALRTWEIEKQYRLRCVRPMILTGDVELVEMEIPLTVKTNDNKVVGTFVPEALTNYVQWVWETGSCWVEVKDDPGRAVVGQLSDGQFVDVDAPLTIDVALKVADATAVWTGCTAGELMGPTQAVIGVKWSRRDIAVFAQKTNTAFKVAKDVAPAVGPGYALELVEEGETENTYVVNESQSEPVFPDPIAFKSITRVDETTWELVVTNIVEFCNYRLIYTDDLTKGFAVTGDWQQATAEMAPTWTTNVVTSGDQLFWKAEAKEGERP